jgi:hypothetical protein
MPSLQSLDEVQVGTQGPVGRHSPAIAHPRSGQVSAHDGAHTLPSWPAMQNTPKPSQSSSSLQGPHGNAGD